MTIGETLRAAREEKGFSVQDVRDLPGYWALP